MRPPNPQAPRVQIGKSPAALLNNTDTFVLVEGPAGTGKTRAILTVMMSRALAWPGSRFLLIRSTRTRLTITVLKTLEEQVFPAFGMRVPGKAGADNRSCYTLPNGSEFIPIGLDDPVRTFSAEFAGAYVAECIEIPMLETVTTLARGLRQSVAPFHQIVLDTNPGPPGHWVNKKAEPVDDSIRLVNTRADYARLQSHNYAPAANPAQLWKRIITRHQDNPAYWDHKAWDWTLVGRKYVETTLNTMSGYTRDRMKAGLWKAASGTVFPEFDRNKHVIEPFRIPDDWPIINGLDPGYDHPAACLYFAVSPNETLYVIDEIYVQGKSVGEIAKLMKKLEDGRKIRRRYADPQDANSKRMASPESIIMQFRKKGYRFTTWPRSTDKEAMVEDYRTRLELGKVKIFDSCTNTIDEHESWMFKRNTRGEQLSGDDQYEDKNNHSLDVILGVNATKPKFASAMKIVDENRYHRKPPPRRRLRPME